MRIVDVDPEKFERKWSAQQRRRFEWKSTDRSVNSASSVRRVIIRRVHGGRCASAPATCRRRRRDEWVDLWRAVSLGGTH
jgi:hypothetical protein